MWYSVEMVYYNVIYNPYNIISNITCSSIIRAQHMYTPYVCDVYHLILLYFCIVKKTTVIVEHKHTQEFQYQVVLYSLSVSNSKLCI